MAQAGADNPHFQTWVESYRHIWSCPDEMVLYRQLLADAWSYCTNLVCVGLPVCAEWGRNYIWSWNIVCSFIFKYNCMIFTFPLYQILYTVFELLILYWIMYFTYFNLENCENYNKVKNKQIIINIIQSGNVFQLIKQNK